jgi:hypothetical protein
VTEAAKQTSTNEGANRGARDALCNTRSKTWLRLVNPSRAAIVLQFLTLHKGAPYGLANWLAVAVILAWLLAISIRLRAVARE